MNFDQLTNFQIFENLSQDDIELFINVMKKTKFNAGEELITEGDKGDCIFLLLDGEAEVNQALTLTMNKGESDQREKAIINLKSETYPQFGEMSMFNDGDLRTANVRSVNECSVARLEKSDLFYICEKNPEIGYKVMRNLARIISANLAKSNKNVLKLTTAFSLMLDR
ncbi:MAG: hypothetical protein CMG08_02005 [Candidatus Marinimicrobia bacterium]|nr:hypothetical protein [Candidatus Neomarinimicrobiota bacterium]